MRCEQAPLWCFVAFAVVSSAAALTRVAGARGARQIGELAREKRSRTAAQKKIDTQLLYALKQKRGETRGVPSAPVDIKLDAAGRALVDITAKVAPGLVPRLERAGAVVLSQSPKYNTVRARVALEKLEAVAEVEGVRYISPAAQAMTHGGARGNND